KAEFEPRVRAARERLARLEAAARAEAGEAERRAGLRLGGGGLRAVAGRGRGGGRGGAGGRRRGGIPAPGRQGAVGGGGVRGRWPEWCTGLPPSPSRRLARQAVHKIVTNVSISGRGTRASRTGEVNFSSERPDPCLCTKIPPTWQTPSHGLLSHRNGWLNTRY